MFGLMAYGCPETGQFQITTSFNLPAQGEGYDLAGGGKSTNAVGSRDIFHELF
jgi:hypothetical protein